MFTCERIDLRDGDGELEATGVMWTEHREWLEFAMYGLVTLGVLIAFFAFLTAPMFGKFWWIPCGVGVSTFLPFFWLCRADFQGTPRQLLFRRDGSMPAPLGFADSPAHFKSVSGLQSDVVSIEARKAPTQAGSLRTMHDHGVALFKRNGDVSYIAQHLLPDQAHKVAVQLTQALAELREDMAIGAIGQGLREAQPHARGRTKPRVNAFID